MPAALDGFNLDNIHKGVQFYKIYMHTACSFTKLGRKIGSKMLYLFT